MSRPTAKQLDRMDTGFKFVGLDLCTHHPEGLIVRDGVS